ncbi:hypothetical protein V8B97DRAFT_1707470 [Scleroderma yunnanense]
MNYTFSCLLCAHQAFALKTIMSVGCSRIFLWQILGPESKLSSEGQTGLWYLFCVEEFMSVTVNLPRTVTAEEKLAHILHGIYLRM